MVYLKITDFNLAYFCFYNKKLQNKNYQRLK